MTNIFTIGHDAKTIKGETYGYLTAICYMVPSRTMCPFASKGCMELCLRESGHLRFEFTKIPARIKTKIYQYNLPVFKERARFEIARLEKKAKKRGLKPAVRFNGTSDVNVLRDLRDIIEAFPGVQFYDYTKRPVQTWVNLPANYHLTFSLSEENAHHALEALKRGFNVAVPFHHVKPTTFYGRPVIDGDLSDLRFLDYLASPQVTDGGGVIVALTAKGIARKARYGAREFVK